MEASLGSSTSLDHQVLVDEAMAEIAGWTLNARRRAFKRWQQGAFSMIHLNVLTLLEAETARSMTHLADTLDVSVASATGIVDRMEKRGLVERLHDQNDRRVVLVRATAKGRSVCSELDGEARDRLGRLVGQLTDEELAGFLVGIRGMKTAHARLAAPALHDASVETDAAPAPAATRPTRVEGGVP